MFVPTVKTLNLLALCLVVPSLLYSLVTQFWNLPLKNGRDFFLGVQVPPGFYEAAEPRWLRRYHAMLLSIYLLVFLSLGTILTIRQWDWIPIWAGSTAMFLTSSMFAFTFWARHRLGGNPPVLPAALSLQPRRLGDYLSWPFEMFCIAAVASSWWMLLQPATGHIDWRVPVCLTWAILGLLPGRITVVRQGWPIPADRAAEHLHAQDAARRYSIRVMDAYGWFMASILFMMALRHAWPPARTAEEQWLVFGIPLASGVFLMIVIAWQTRIMAMGRTLRPPGSWAPPFGRATIMSRSGLIWFSIWFGGTVLLMLLWPH